MTSHENERVELSSPDPMLPPVPCAILGVMGDERVKDQLVVLWSFVVSAEPPLIGLALPEKSKKTGQPFHIYEFIKKHGEFTLSIADVSMIDGFDKVDMSSSEIIDKFALSGLTRLESKLVKAPGIAEAPIVLECKVHSTLSHPPERAIILGEVIRTTVKPGVVDSKGKLNPQSRPFFGMVTGCGEFWTFGNKAGHIGQTKGRDDIRF